jgi:signal peptidase I
MPQLFLNNLIAAVAGLAIPGLGHAVKGHWRLGLGFQAMTLGGVILFSLSRLIVSPYGLEGLAIFLAIVHVSSSVTAACLSSVTGSQWWRLVAASGFSLASLALALGLFVSKASWLGVNVYYIPSASMLPTLRPGDLIMVDTWAYHEAAPETGDIVTFQSPLNGQITVKRVSDIDTNTLPERLFVLGDNADHSFDSRTYGWLDKSRVTGSVTRIFRPPLL